MGLLTLPKGENAYGAFAVPCSSYFPRPGEPSSLLGRQTLLPQSGFIPAPLCVIMPPFLKHAKFQADTPKS